MIGCTALRKMLLLHKPVRCFLRGCHGKARQSMSFETGGLRIDQHQSKNFFQWSTTDEGRKEIGQKVILIGGTIITTVSWCWHMFLVDWMKDSYSTYENRQGRSMESLAGENKKVGALSESFQRLFTSAQSRAGLKDHTMDNIDIFYSKSLDAVSAGLARGSQGAVVGFPEHMLQDKVDLSSLRVKPGYNYFHKGYRLPSNLCQEAIEDLQRTMVLTPEEREFVMARELARVNTWAALRETILFPLLFVAHYVFANEINTRTGLIHKSRNVRWAVQLGLAAASLCALIIVKNFHLFETDQEAIDAVCKTPLQAEIAMNFYQKTLNRNKVLREILGPDSDGGYSFTPEGEYQPFFYEIPQLTSLRVRRDYCKELRHSID